MNQLALIEVESVPEYEPVETISTPLGEQRRLIAFGPWMPKSRAGSVPDRSIYLPGDRGDPPRRNGQIQPRRFSSLTMLKAIPGVIGFFDKAVPGEFWSRDADTAGPLAIVACPCGEEVEVPEVFIEECDCGRFYWNVTDRVLVGKS